MSGAIEKLISESEVVAHLYAVAGSVGEMIDAASSELAALREELAAYKLTLLDTESQYEAGLDIIKGLRAENARLGEALARNMDLLRRLGEFTDPSSPEDEAIDRAIGEAVRALSDTPAGIFLTLDQAREIEWAAEGCDVRGGEVTTYDACPACGGAHPRFEPNQPSQLGHATDCFLAAKIKQAEILMRPSNPTEVTDDARNVTGEDEIIEDGFGNAWSSECPTCGGRMEVVRPGKAQCENCG